MPKGEIFMSLSGLQVVQIINRISDEIEKNKEYLTSLDAAIGDGDHGLNMSKGFLAVKQKLKDDSGKNIGETLKKVAMTLISNVGGASGPLYGTAFMKAAAEVSGKENIDIEDFLRIMKAALQGIKMRGKAELGEKTMIDAIEPAIKVIEEGINLRLSTVKILFNAKESALKGAERTENIVATKGRASYLGERSIGHRDPGATSSYIIMNTIYEEIEKINA
jgi:dihydroxyacetone kinase-like protein